MARHSRNRTSARRAKATRLTGQALAALVVDGRWSVIGSANMDNISRKLNDEVVLGISDTDFAGRLAKNVAADSAHTQPITIAQWPQRSLCDRLLEWIALASVQQY